jgi:hypothetical protein
MSKSKKSPTGAIRIESKPKKTKQGNGRNSKASHGRKLSRGQGKG